MPEILLVIWLPVAIAAMAVTWVITLGALGRPVAAIETPVLAGSPSLTDRN